MLILVFDIQHLIDMDQVFVIDLSTKKYWNQSKDLIFRHTNGINSSGAAVNDDRDGWLPWKADTPLKDFSRRSRRLAVKEPNSKFAGVISWPANWGLNSSIPKTNTIQNWVNALGPSMMIRFPLINK